MIKARVRIGATLPTTLTAFQHATKVEYALEQSASNRISGLLPPPPWDYNVVDIDSLARLAQTLSADAWTPTLATDQYRRELIQDAVKIHRLRGTPASLTVFSLRAGFVASYTLNRDSGNARNESVNVFITPTVYQDSDFNWVAYVRRVIAGLLPLGIAVNSITVAPITDVNTHVGAVARTRDILFLSEP